MNPSKEFTLTLNYEAETERNGMDRLSFHDKFAEPFYLSPNQWEVGLLKSLIPHSRLIPMPSLSFEISNTINHEDPFDLQARYVYRFDLTSQIEYSIEDHIEKWNKQIKSILLTYERDANAQTFSFEIKYENYKLIISEFRHDIYGNDQSSKVKFLKNGEWRKLGFLNVFNSGDEHDCPCQATSEMFKVQQTTTLTLSSPNLIESQLFGDTYKPVIELLHYHFSRQGTHIEYSFTTPSYKRLIGGYISEIDLELEDLDEKIISLPLSYFQFVLHFRPCQSSIKMR